ncbi:MAG: 2-octaprenyl-6-methoxyphenyl hydroxylase [Methylibium sp. NZG]|nr:MAG: 2-octaprenyl-6-methoxyphenyl hydroxylase [Methylibium sp. NZG]
MTESNAPLSLAIVGAGPVGLALALHASQALPQAQVTLFDARPADKDVSGDPRTLALSLGSVQWLQRLGAWRNDLAQPILEVHVSQQPPSAGALLGAWLGEPEVRIRAADAGVPMLGAVLSYGHIVAPLQQAWEAAALREPRRLLSRFGAPVAALKNLAPPLGGVEVDAGIADRFDLAVVAEGGVFGGPTRTATAPPQRAPVRHDYQQTAWVGQVTFEGDGASASPMPRVTRAPGVAFERFTRHGPAALLPLKDGRAALVWCVSTLDDPVRELDDVQRVAVLNSIFHPSVGRIATVSPLKQFALGLNAERTLVDGRTVRIGNAAQTLHPVAGQGLNLGLRDGYELVHALARSQAPGATVDSVLRRLEWQRAPDRWAMIAATDFLARSFTWKLPGAGAARGLGLAALQALRPVKSALARQMMYGSR